jgi:cytoskeletal protein CcmA (bactofilin family)
MDEAESTPEETIEITTLLGKGCCFDGKLTFEGTVRIDGHFVGQIASNDILVVGPEGQVKADVDIGALIVEGVLEGTVRARRSVEIHAPGRVRGNIMTPSLFIDRGVVFEGNCHVTDAPLPDPVAARSSGGAA